MTHHEKNPSSQLLGRHSLGRARPRPSKRRNWSGCAVFVLALWSIAIPCHADAQRGAPVTVTPLARWDAARVSDYLKNFELDPSRVRYGIDAYRVVYRTISATGLPTTASSLVAVPRNGTRDVELAIWLHGTTVFKGDAASVSDESDDRGATFMLAAAGYATTAPDYLGLGEGPGTHPYDDRATEVSASLDALRATVTLAEWLQRRVDPRIAISGFSQGGASSLALARAIEQDEQSRFQVRALAPIGGPYDMSGTLATAVSGGIEHVTAYLAYVTVAWNRLHYLYASPSDAFLSPYDRTIESLFDNTHPAEEVLSALPETLDALFTPQYLALLAAPSGALREALAEADSVCDWKPSVETVLYTSTNDRDVPIANARTCEHALLARGGNVRVIDFGEPDHGGTFVRALPHVIEQFDAS
jgi:acetyl esterase/lipase